MEDVLEVYARPYDPRRPVVCMDETHKQLIGEVREPLPVAPGQPERVEHEYVRNGVAQIFLEVEPLTGRCHVEATERRTRQDWARWSRIFSIWRSVHPVVCMDETNKQLIGAGAFAGRARPAGASRA